MTTFEQKALDLLNQNKRKTLGHIYTVPSPENYPYQWLWDSCFHAIVLSHFDNSWAKQELLSLVSKQFENGLLPHMIYWVPNPKIPIQWGKKDTSTITQPPIIADSVLQVYEKDKDTKFLNTIYPPLRKYYQYLLRERDARGKHLISIINPDESGEDNSPRFDIQLSLLPVHKLSKNFQQRLKLVHQNLQCDFESTQCMKNFFWTKDLPFNAFMVKNLVTLSKIAKILKKDSDYKYFIDEANAIKKAISKYMFEDGLFWSVYEESYQKIKVKTWAIFIPLYGELLSRKQAEQLVDEHLLNKNEFWLKFPVPTVAKDEPSFNPEGFWRGPTWIATNWFIFKGLLNYGFTGIAKEIFKISKYLVENEGFREYFNPQTGKGLGAKNFTWGTLVLDMERSLEK